MRLATAARGLRILNVSELILAFRILIMIGIGRRLWLDGVKVSRQELPWTRLAVPTLILISAILVANNLIPRVYAAGALLGIDLVILASCIGIVVSLRRSKPSHSIVEVIDDSLGAYFPSWFSKLVAGDLVIIAHAAIGLKAFIAPAKPTTFSYVHGSKIALAGAVVALSVLPDAVLFEFLIPRHFWWAAILLDVLNVWGCLWLFGVYGTMVRRPHVVSPNGITLHNGIMQRITFEPENVAQAKSIGLIKSYKLGRKRHDGSTVLTFGGVSLVQIRLKTPVLEKHLFSVLDRDVQTIYVASDESAKLALALVRDTNLDPEVLPTRHSVSSPRHDEPASLRL